MLQGGLPTCLLRSNPLLHGLVQGGSPGELEYIIKRSLDVPWPAVPRVVFNQTVGWLAPGWAAVVGSNILLNAPATVACLQPWLDV